VIRDVRDFGISSQALFGQLLIGLNASFYALLSLGLAVPDTLLAHADEVIE
jgi:hypothetical protein